jgi:hypothetical protein
MANRIVTRGFLIPGDTGHKIATLGFVIPVSTTIPVTVYRLVAKAVTREITPR